LLDAAYNKDLRSPSYGVDRSQKEGLGMSERFEIGASLRRSFLRDGIELGRIVETLRRLDRG
jgi:hypothetical protein